MKTNKFLTLVLTIVASLAIVSCVQDDDYTIPTSLGDEENARLNTLLANGTILTIQEAKDKYTSDPNGDGDTTDAMPFIEEVEDIYIKGYVSSSDKSGNFFKEFFIQDSPTNPTIAIKVIINQVDLYNQFNFGREVYVSLKGVYIGEERVGNGVIAIGGGVETDRFGTTVTSLGENRSRTHVFRSSVTEDMMPLNVNFPDISADHVGVLVQIDNAEFADNLAGKRYFDPMEDFDTKRTLQSCGGFNYSTFQLETSGFATFKNELLPTGNGSITAVVSKTFDASALVLVINDIEDVDFNNSRCELLNEDDFTAVFSEDFEGMTTGSTISGNGWTAYAETGTYNWRALTTSDSGNPGPGNIIASMGAYNSGVISNITWLITPMIDLEAQDIEFVNFQTSNSFSDGSELELLISTDWDGTTVGIATATWSPLSGTIVSDSTSFRDWVDSGNINLSSYSGNAYIAFKYIGGDDSGSNPPQQGTIDGTYEMDNFKVLVQN